jgi:ribose 5-phosphate isomerase B
MVKPLIGCDHAGYSLKEKMIREREFVDYSPDLVLDDDYPDTAVKVVRDAVKKKAKAVLICGSGIGMCVAANKVKGVRAAVCRDVGDAVLARRDDDCNVLCMGGRITGKDTALRIIDAFFATPFAGKLAGGTKYKRRVKKVNSL